MRELLGGLYEELVRLDARIARYDAAVEQLAAAHPPCRRLMHVPGIGPTIATALVAAVGDAEAFANGRTLAAWLGLVPRQPVTVSNRLEPCKTGGDHIRVSAA